MIRSGWTAASLLALSLCFTPSVSHADWPGNDYCVTPAFVSGNIPPNLLLMIDNSASMYDLAYSDRGKKHCSIATGKSCFIDSDCSAGEGTCSVFDRQPYYCYDETYSNSNTYSGYFPTKDGSNNDIYYSYRPATDDFVPASSAFPAGCPSASATNVKYSIANTMCLEYVPGVTTTNPIVSFIAKGNYLNWLTTSKFDVQKQILTGGKFVTKVCSSDANRPCIDGNDCVSPQTCVTVNTSVCSGDATRSCTADTDCVSPQTCGTPAATPFLQPESRGCVGQPYIKQPLSQNFVNYASTMVNYVPTPADPNTANKLTMAFAVHGPTNPDAPSAPSKGGQTYIDLFAGKVYNYAACQAAITAMATGTNAEVKKEVAACLSSVESQYCALAPATTCTDDHPDCDSTITNVCSNDLTKTYIATCDPANPATSCTTPSNLYCSGDNNRKCAVTTPDCKKATSYYCDYGSPTHLACTVATSGAAGSSQCNVTNNSKRCYSSNGTNIVDAGKNCSTSTDCATGQLCLQKGNFNCVSANDGYDYGTCSFDKGSVSYGTCLASYTKYLGPCLFTGGTSPITKAKVAFQQSMHSCWQLRRGTSIGVDEVRTSDNQCTAVYNSYFTCSDNHQKTCTFNSDCASNLCVSGPAAIAAGNPALICGSNYIGQFYVQTNGVWAKSPSVTDEQVEAVYTQFCTDSMVPNVTDPTDAPSDTPTYDNLPAILSGVGIESQMGTPIATMRVRVNTAAPTCTKDSDCASGKTCSDGSCKPAGLVQKFGSQMRLGAMTFNPYGSASETALTGVKVPKVCSNDPSKSCTQPIDCGTAAGITCNETVIGTSNLDGGAILYPIGKGVCAAMTTTPCSSDGNCSLGAKCLSNGYCGTKDNSTVCTTALTCTGTAPQACIRDAAGDHNARSLVSIIDGIRANAWTPFAETFYNALGYFAAVPSGSSFLSRTDLRLNGLRTTSKDFSSFSAAPVDFNEALQPSEYRCQQNYILMVSDGSSTADRNSTVNTLATTYATQANATAGSCTVTAPTVDYGGSSNVPVLSWIGNHQNLASFSTDAVTALYCPDKVTPCTDAGVCPTTNDRSCASYHCSVHTATSCGGGSPAANYGCPSGEVCTRNPRDYVTTYVVFNGADNGANGVCDAYTLLDKTARNGGTTLKQASDPASLTTALTSIFENIAAKASSGTAASILSNSEGSGANILQAVFYPKKVFSSQTSSNWIGEMQNLWYYVDPMINHSTIREDTNSDRKLNLLQDHVVSLRFDNSDNTTYAYVSTDTNGDGIGDTTEVKEDPDLVTSVWRAGRQLWQRNLTTAPRTIYTTLLPTGTETMYGPSSTVHSGLMKFNYGSTTVADDATFPLATALSAGMSPAPNNEPALRSYLQMADSASGVKLMQYVHGFDFPGDANMRSRTVQTTTIKTDTVAAGGIYPDASLTSAAYTTNPASYGLGVWKLGDIISSTPRIQSNGRLNSYSLPSPSGYSDQSYTSFINSNDYRGRGMVYVGANDGMLHAFKLGLLDVTASGFQKATLSESGLGEEQWAFIPKQALPYLKYYSDPAYNHIYYVDGTTLITDASIGIPTGCTGSYYTCAKSLVAVDPATNNLDADKNTWRTVLIGGTGLGGASAKSCTGRTDCVATPTTDPADGTGNTGLGFSSYYALDVTDPKHPKRLWEFSDPTLGYATSGPAIVRVGDRDKNGRWFAVFGSGPTGKIDTANHQFMGRSDQPLRFFAVDLATGVATELNDTYHIDNAFAGSMVGGAIDADRWNPNVTGNYKDDAILVGYTAKPTGGTDWTSGGVLRITTKESTNPADWVVSPVITGIGPVTTAISRLQDRKNRALWLYFGTGRYYSRSGDSIDDYQSRRAIFGIKDPCYNFRLNPGNLYDKTCVDEVSTGDVANQTSEIHTVGAGGWQIDLDQYTDDYGAERVVTDAVALTNGTVFITSFEPTSDICGFGGNSYLWALAYNTGDRPSNAALAGKALIQLSTGEFKEVNLSEAFGSDASKLFRRTSIPMTGKPPADAFPVVSKSSNKPVKKIMHIQER